MFSASHSLTQLQQIRELCFFVSENAGKAVKLERELNSLAVPEA